MVPRNNRSRGASMGTVGVAGRGPIPTWALAGNMAKASANKVLRNICLCITAKFNGDARFSGSLILIRLGANAWQHLVAVSTSTDVDVPDAQQQTTQSHAGTELKRSGG